MLIYTIVLVLSSVIFKKLAVWAGSGWVEWRRREA